MSDFELTNTWARVRRRLDRQTADAVLSKHGGYPGQPSSVPEGRVDDCVAALKVLVASNPDDDGDDGNGFETAKAKPKALDAAAIYRKWNSPSKSG